MSNLLHHYHLKNTKKRQAVIHVLEQSPIPLPIEQIHEQASLTMQMNLSTVYRTISTLCEHSIVVQSINQEGKAYYRLNHHRHEHYLICKKCHKILLVEECPLHELEAKLEQQTGFQIMDHRLEFFGLCPNCQKPKTSQKER